MSCKECNDNPIHGAYIRWKNANIEIVACEKHWKEIRKVLVDAQSKERNETRIKTHDFN